MAPPSYARATLSSTLKASPISTKAGDNTPPSQGSPRKLKRPSLLTDRKRDVLHYLQNLHPIRPRDKSRPCGFANLPSEIRIEIYKWVFAQRWHHPARVYDGERWTRDPKYIWPDILHICRAMRIEAAHTYFTGMPFHWWLRNLDFRPVNKWVDMLPREHRVLLSQNPYMVIDITPMLKDDYGAWYIRTEPPSGYLMDDSLENHWKRCEPFGNLHSLSSDVHRKHFIAFCRFATWWSWCSRSANRSIRWEYTFGQQWWPTRERHQERLYKEILLRFLQKIVGVVLAPCVQKTWTRNKCGADMKKEALRLVKALDEWWEDKIMWATNEEFIIWPEKRDIIQDAIERW